MERTHLLTSFQDFGLADPISRALKEENYLTPTPIQAQTIPLAITGRDVVGIAQTGTGKTAAFALPILHRILENRIRVQPKTCRVLVLSPTRELSGQILDSFNAYGRHIRLSSALAIGGVPMGRQVRSVMQGVEVMVATPGRLLDLVQSNGLKLGQVEFLVLDEADRMLDMGFINDIRKIVAKLPIKRQTLFFSATMPKDIAELAEAMLRDPARVAVTPVSSTVERITQRIIQVDFAAKPGVLAQLLKEEPVNRALIFTRTKHGADKVVKGLAKVGISGGRHSRQQVAEPPRARAGGVPHRRDPHPGRHRHRRPRHRRRRHQPCGEFRPAQHSGNLRPPHRPHRARRRRGHCDLADRGRRGDGLPARHRAADPRHAAAGRPPYARQPRRRAGSRATPCATPGRTIRTARPWRQDPGVQGHGSNGHDSGVTNPGDMKQHQDQKALAVLAAAVVIMPRRSRTGTNSRVRRNRPARAKAGKVRAFRASPSCIARAVRILNPTVPTDRSASLDRPGDHHG